MLESVRKTNRLLVVHEDRVFASLGREIQGATLEAMGATAVATRVLGQDAVPGIPQNIELEEHIVVSPAKVVAAAEQVMQIDLRRAAAPAQASEPRRVPTVVEPARTRVLWTPNRAFVS